MQTNRKIRTCVLDKSGEIALVFEQPYTYTPANPEDGTKFKEITLGLPQFLKICDVEDGSELSDTQYTLSYWIERIEDARLDLCAQCFVDYWGQKEPQS